MIRPTDARDRPAVVDLVRAAFDPGDDEAGIVERTWVIDDPGTVDLVADEDGVVGHVLVAPGRLDGRDPLPGLAPLAVAPPRQRSGVGSALMAEALRRCEEAGWPGVVLLGDPGYYGRFGFEAAGPCGVVYEPVGAESPYFLVRRFDGDLPRGRFTYAWEAPLGADGQVTLPSTA